MQNGTLFSHGARKEPVRGKAFAPAHTSTQSAAAMPSRGPGPALRAGVWGDSLMEATLAATERASRIAARGVGGPVPWAANARIRPNARDYTR